MTCKMSKARTLDEKLSNYSMFYKEKIINISFFFLLKKKEISEMLFKLQYLNIYCNQSIKQ